MLLSLVLAWLRQRPLQERMLVTVLTLWEDRVVAKRGRVDLSWQERWIACIEEVAWEGP